MPPSFNHIYDLAGSSLQNFAIQSGIQRWATRSPGSLLEMQNSRSIGIRICILRKTQGHKEWAEHFWERGDRWRREVSFLQIQANLIPRRSGYIENILFQRREFPRYKIGHCSHSDVLLPPTTLFGTCIVQYGSNWSHVQLGLWHVDCSNWNVTQ